MSTPHNAAGLEEIAQDVIMTGDPLRARYVAERYLLNPRCFNTVRNMLGYTGKYLGRRISVMGHGMGAPSMGIYSYELFSVYGVERIVRVGSCAGLAEGMSLGDLVLAMGTSTDSNYAAQFGLPGTLGALADFGLLRVAEHQARQLGTPCRVGNVLSSDVFYMPDRSVYDAWGRMGVLGVEMECNALYLNAARTGKKALGILTVSDVNREGTWTGLTTAERETSFHSAMELALKTLLV